jgi:hypothetical protein
MLLSMEILSSLKNKFSSAKQFEKKRKLKEKEKMRRCNAFSDVKIVH